MEKYPTPWIPYIYEVDDALPEPMPQTNKACGKIVYADLYCAIIEAEKTMPDVFDETQEFTNHCLCHISWTHVNGETVVFMNENISVGDVISFIFDVQQTRSIGKPLYCIVYDVITHPPKFKEVCRKNKGKTHKKRSAANAYLSGLRKDLESNITTSSFSPEPVTEIKKEDANLPKEDTEKLNSVFLGQKLKENAEPQVHPRYIELDLKSTTEKILQKSKELRSDEKCLVKRILQASKDMKLGVNPVHKKIIRESEDLPSGVSLNTESAVDVSNNTGEFNSPLLDQTLNENTKPKVHSSYKESDFNYKTEKILRELKEVRSHEKSMVKTFLQASGGLEFDVNPIIKKILPETEDLPSGVTLNTESGFEVSDNTEEFNSPLLEQKLNENAKPQVHSSYKELDLKYRTGKLREYKELGSDEKSVVKKIPQASGGLEFDVNPIIKKILPETEDLPSGVTLNTEFGFEVSDNTKELNSSLLHQKLKKSARPQAHLSYEELDIKYNIEKTLRESIESGEDLKSVVKKIRQECIGWEFNVNPIIEEILREFEDLPSGLPLKTKSALEVSDNTVKPQAHSSYEELELDIKYNIKKTLRESIESGDDLKSVVKKIRQDSVGLGFNVNPIIKQILRDLSSDAASNTESAFKVSDITNALASFGIGESSASVPADCSISETPISVSQESTSTSAMQNTYIYVNTGTKPKASNSVTKQPK